MPINLDKPHLWNADTAASIDLFNNWFLKSAPKAYRETRLQAIEAVENALRITSDFRELTADVLKSHPGILPTLRMACCPPLAVDRLIGLSKVARPHLVKKGLELGKIPGRISAPVLDAELEKIIAIVTRLLDRDIFIWLKAGNDPNQELRHRAATIVADRLCGSIANPIIKNAQEKRQLASLREYLTKRGYAKKVPRLDKPLTEMEPGTFCFHLGVATVAGTNESNVSVDVVIQPFRPRPNRVPILVEAKSAGDFTNTNKRRKEEAKKIAQLKGTFGEDVCYILFLCGYFNSAYLGYEAAEGIDWVWEHRIDDLQQLGI